MSAYPEWKLGLIDSAWFGSQYEGRPGRQEAKKIGFDSLDLFIGFDPGRMTAAERQSYVADVRAADLPIPSLVCTCLGLSDFNPAVRSYHIERAKNVLDLASDFSARNLCFVPGEYMFQRRLIPAEGEWKLVVDATQQVGRHAAERGLELAIELLPFEYAFIRTLDDMERFLDGVGLENVKATVDISHFWLMRIAAARARSAQGQDRSCSRLRLRRGQSWRPPSRARQHSVRGVPFRDSRHGLRRRRVGRARIPTRLESDARLGGGGLWLDAATK